MALTDPLEFFRRLYCALTKNPTPFPWQEELFTRFCSADIPGAINLPTGSGKTSVIDVWLLGLAYQAQTSPNSISLPRRIVWVVDRRAVVDQATQEAEGLASNLSDPPSELADLAALVRTLSLAKAGAPPLAVSTLRGEFADNREWSLDPSRPAIIIGTVDMVGSRLLFSGYGDSRRRRALHAGLLGQDTLIVNDEAHLTPAFAHLLIRLRGIAGGERPLRTMLLSATPRGDIRPALPRSLDGDLTNDVFKARYRAVKRLHLSESEEPAKEIQKLATEPDRRTIVFVRSPEGARKLAAAIQGKHKGIRVPLVTGMQRGRERDGLLKDPVVARFLGKDPLRIDAEPCWLVATSAGEVGIDLSADRLITDLDTADHLLQRFGRLNRFGETEGDAYVVYSPKQLTGEKGDAPRLKATLDYLRGLPNVMPETLWMQPPPGSALSAEPYLAPLLPWHIDVWSMTSLSAADWPSRPAVEHWLHGDDEKGALPETYVAWRDDVADLADPRVSQSDREEVLDCYPVLAQERLKQYTGALCEALEDPRYLGKPAILIAADGEIYVGTLAELNRRGLLSYGTLLLPPGVGYLDENGMVDWSRSTDGLSQADLARYDVSVTDTRNHVRLAPGEAQPEMSLRWRYTVKLPTDDEDEKGPRWVYFVGEFAQKGPRPAPELLTDHQERLASLAASLAGHLGMDERTIRVFEWAGRWHDAGKARAVWQRAAGNAGGSLPLAKSEHLKVSMLGGYRHELGSLLDAAASVPSDFTTDERDLALHLIAAHHGWARPHFPKRTFDKDACRRSELAALDSARRFGRLQRRFGAWGLAYLEAVFRSADAIASANTPELPANA